MGTGFLITIIIILFLAFFLVKLIEKIIKTRFFKVKSIITATTAYDLCKLYQDGIISERELTNEVAHWIFVPDNQELGDLREEWRTILPPDPFGTFEDQVGQAFRDGLVSSELYNKLMKIYRTSDTIRRDDNDEDY